MDIFKIDQTSIDAIAYKAAKIVVSELKRCEEPQLEMVPVSVAAKILGISEDHMRRIKDKFPHIKNSNNKQGRLLIMKVLTVLLKHTCTDIGYDYARPGWNSYLHSGQTLISDADLAEFCNCDVETVSDIIRMLNNSGLISTISNSSVSIHTLLFLDEIHDKGKTVFNPRCQDQRLREEESIYQTQMALKYAEVKVDNISQNNASHGMEKAFEYLRQIKELDNYLRKDNLNEMGDK